MNTKTIVAVNAARNLRAMNLRVGNLMDKNVRHALVMTAYDLDSVECAGDAYDADAIASHAYDYMIDAGMSHDDAAAAADPIGSGAFVA